MSDRIKREVAMELFTDLAEANRNFLKNALPNFPAEVRVVSDGGFMGVVIQFKGELDEAELMGYPNFVKLSAVMRPTPEYQKMLGIWVPGMEE